MSWTPDQLLLLARAGRLYPSVILSGGTAEERRNLAFELGRTLLCERAAEERPCNICNNCRRIDSERYLDEAKAKASSEKNPKGAAVREMGVRQSHPDFLLLERPQGRKLISVHSVRPLVASAQMAPFEARGQVFAIADADTLHPFGAEALLKTLEEPVGDRARNFLLLTPSAQDLLPTLRSRSLTVYLGGERREASDEQIDDLTEHWRQQPGDERLGPWLADLAAKLVAVGGKDIGDVRNRGGWTRMAAAVSSVARRLELRSQRAAAHAFAADLLDAHLLRMRFISPDRIIRGLGARRLRRESPATGFGSAVEDLLGLP